MVSHQIPLLLPIQEYHCSKSVLIHCIIHFFPLCWIISSQAVNMLSLVLGKQTNKTFLGSHFLLNSYHYIYLPSAIKFLKRMVLYLSSPFLLFLFLNAFHSVFCSPYSTETELVQITGNLNTVTFSWRFTILIFFNLAAII